MQANQVSHGQAYQVLLEQVALERTVGEVCRFYREYAADKLSDERLASVERYLAAFTSSYGCLPLGRCTPLLVHEFIQAHPSWRSAHTRHGVNVIVQRAFNWAVQMRLIASNPFRGVSFPAGPPQRAITDAEWQSLIEFAGPTFRPVLLFLRWTGMRPIELCTMKWSDVDFEQGVIRLAQHKTAKTQRRPRPRLIVLTDEALALLRQMEQARKRPAAEVIREVLAGGPLRAEEFRRRLAAAGVDPHCAANAGRLAGAHSYRAGGFGKAGWWEWALLEHLPKDRGLITLPGRQGFYAHVYQDGRQILRKLADDRLEAQKRLAQLTALDLAYREDCPPAAWDHVFLNSHHTPWNRRTLGQQLRRLCRRIGLPKGVRLYSLRHRFGTDAIRKGVGLKVLAELMGHTTCAVTERYVHLAGDVPLLREAVNRMFAGSAEKGGAA